MGIFAATHTQSPRLPLLPLIAIGDALTSTPRVFVIVTVPPGNLVPTLIGISKITPLEISFTFIFVPSKPISRHVAVPPVIEFTV